MVFKGKTAKRVKRMRLGWCMAGVVKGRKDLDKKKVWGNIV